MPVVVPKPAPPAKPAAPAPRKVVRDGAAFLLDEKQDRVAPQAPPTVVFRNAEGILQRYTWSSKDGKIVTLHPNTKNLPEDARKVVEAGAAEEAAIRADIQRQIDAKHAETVKRLEALQDEYTKAGKLDEALAIRDFLRSPAGIKYGLPVIKR